MVLDLLGPLGSALYSGQSDGRGHGKVRSALFKMHKHVSEFEYPPSAGRAVLKQHVFLCFLERKSYTFRAVHTLAYILDSLYVDSPAQQGTAEMSHALDVLKTMGAAHHFKLALASLGCKKETDVPLDCNKITRDNVMGEFTSFRAKAARNLVLPLVWRNSAVENPLAWWNMWGSAVPHPLSVAV